ncbi:MAG TPA: hypothetical protein VL651_09125 [Bacteroidia bacterium]|jgi:hypothetical protein|nr:hypothetical protein [Bacteroidia bacterium]
MTKNWPYYFFPGVFVLLCSAAILSTGVYDSGDGVMHYLFAHYAGAHPSNLLDTWGKPIYTLLSFPFAHFGYKGSVIFNIICLTLTSYFTWRIAQKLKIPFCWMAAPLVIFAPLALPVSMSALTEPLFALILVWSINVLLSGRVGLSAIIISFLPFARQEGFLILLLFVIYFLTRKDLLTIAFLFTGTVLYSIAGAFHFHDLFWVIRNNPYVGEKNYGNGSLFEFVLHFKTIWGYALSALMLAGIAFYFFAKRNNILVHRAEYFFIAGIFFLFLSLHSFFWYKGLFGSLGLHRVMVCTFPLAVLLGIRGLHFTLLLLKRKPLVMTVGIIAIALQAYQTWKYNPLPFKITEREQLMQNVALELKNRVFPPQPAGFSIYCANPYMAFALETDPFDHDHWKQFTCTCPEVKFRNGDLVIWDSHFAQFDIPITLQEMQHDTRFRQLILDGEIPKDKSEEENKFALGVFEYHVEITK